MKGSNPYAGDCCLSEPICGFSRLVSSPLPSHEVLSQAQFFSFQAETFTAHLVKCSPQFSLPWGGFWLPLTSFHQVHTQAFILLKAALCSVRPSRAFLSLDHKPFGCLTLPRPQMHFSKSQSFRKQSWSRYPSRTENIPHLIFRVQKCQGFAESSIIDVPSAGEGVCILKPTIPFFCFR